MQMHNYIATLPAASGPDVTSREFSFAIGDAAPTAVPLTAADLTTKFTVPAGQTIKLALVDINDHGARSLPSELTFQSEAVVPPPTPGAISVALDPATPAA